MKSFVSSACFILFSLLAYSQDNLKKQLDMLVDKYYPNPSDPGIMFQINDNSKNILYSASRGTADLKTNTPISPKTNFRMASVSKQFTAMAIYKLIDEKKLDIYNTKLEEFFPELNGPIKNCNIYYLINHTSGILDYENLIPTNQKEKLSDSDVLKLIQPIDSIYFKSGTKFRYSNTAYCLLALIVEKVTGKDYSSFVKAEFFDKLKMSNSLVYNPTDKISDRAFGYHLDNKKFKYADQSITSATKGDGGVYTSAEEYLLWNDSYLQFLGSNLSFSSFFENNKVPINKNISYSFGKFVGSDQYGNTVYFHTGESTGFNNFVLTIPYKNISISLFSNRDDQIISKFIDDVLNVLDIKVKGLEDMSLFSWLSNVYMNKY